jgi:hypothetical protein
VVFPNSIQRLLHFEGGLRFLPLGKWFPNVEPWNLRQPLLLRGMEKDGVAHRPERLRRAVRGCWVAGRCLYPNIDLRLLTFDSLPSLLIPRSLFLFFAGIEN